MSFAVIQTGGKQYRVKAGEILKIEKLELKKDSNRVEFDNILAYGD
ncbi:MAG: 50S ribosomal protein L21, partial [Flavobacteriales bacterium TMED235]